MNTDTPVLSELDIGGKLLQLLPRDNANNNPAIRRYNIHGYIHIHGFHEYIHIHGFHEYEYEYRIFFTWIISSLPDMNMNVKFSPWGALILGAI